MPLASNGFFWLPIEARGAYELLDGGVRGEKPLAMGARLRSWPPYQDCTAYRYQFHRDLLPLWKTVELSPL